MRIMYIMLTIGSSAIPFLSPFAIIRSYAKTNLLVIFVVISREMPFGALQRAPQSLHPYNWSGNWIPISLFMANST